MSTCAKRSVIQVGDRPARVRKAALEVQSAARAAQQRVLPSTGQRAASAGRPLNHGMSGMDPLAALARAIDQMAREVSDAFGPPQGPMGGGRSSTTANTSAGTGGTGNGGYSRAEVLTMDVDAPYTEPMPLVNPNGFRTVAIIAGRIRDLANPTRYFRSGVGCDWYANGNNNIVLRSIDGMTIGDPTVLRFTFILYGVANG